MNANPDIIQRQLSDSKPRLGTVETGTYSSFQQSPKNTRLQVECTVCRILPKVQQEVAGVLLTDGTVKPAKAHWIIKIADGGQG